MCWRVIYVYLYYQCDLRDPEISKETEPDLSAAYLDSSDMQSPMWAYMSMTWPGGRESGSWEEQSQKDKPHMEASLAYTACHQGQSSLPCGPGWPAWAVYGEGKYLPSSHSPCSTPGWKLRLSVDLVLN